MHNFLSPSRRTQRGAATLLVALVLLLGGTIIAFFANRGFIFEQRTSANQYRATSAFELAEAGAEWALGKVNENLPLTSASSCTASSSTTAFGSFRERFATPRSAGAGGCTGGLGCLDPANTGAPGCRISSAGVTTCDCQAAAAASLGASSPEEGRFGVRIRSGGDPTMIEIISRGCANGNGTCDPNVTSTADATAVVRLLAKIVPAVPSGPAAALTSGSATVIGGNLRVVNNDTASNGITIHAGTTVSFQGNGISVQSLPGTPPRASVLDNDPSLATLTNASEDAFFANYFGQTLTNYRDVDPDVIRVGPGVPVVANRCNSSSTCSTIVTNIVNSGVRNPRFYVDSDLDFNGGTLGSASNPVIIVTSGDLGLRGNIVARGLFYAATTTATENWDFPGSGSATVFGAFISRGDFIKGSGSLDLIYDPSLWGKASPPTGRLVRVPGSWRDKLTEY
jgi:Tfp pilus assembly protein PilX